MKKNLLVMERYILESLNSSAKSFSQIHEDTQLDYALLNNVLSELMMKNMISFRKGVYALNLAQKDTWLPEINSKESLNGEVKELCGTIVDEHFSQNSQESCLKVQKVFLTAEEEKIFQSYLINLEKFIQGIQKQEKLKSSKSKVKDQKVILWGAINYKKVVDGTLRAA